MQFYVDIIDSVGFIMPRAEPCAYANLYRVCQNAAYTLGGDVENIVKAIIIKESII